MKLKGEQLTQFNWNQANQEPVNARQGEIMYSVTEFKGKGDPWFGGSSDDRPLGTSGLFLTGCWNGKDRAVFSTKEQATLAANKASNRREGGLIGVWMNNRA